VVSKAFQVLSGQFLYTETTFPKKQMMTLHQIQIHKSGQRMTDTAQTQKTVLLEWRLDEVLLLLQVHLVVVGAK
jgi:hypothetical protein